MDSSRIDPLPAPPGNVPLVVDLDGTLILTDTLWESLIRLLRRNPLYALAALSWWSRGRANLKRQLALRVALDPAALPYHEPLLEYLRAEKARGRSLILATASDIGMAQPVAEHVRIFDDVLASDGKHNLRGRRKGQVLCERHGERGFDYAGNSRVDLSVWSHAREAIVVNASPSLARRAAAVATLGTEFLGPRRYLQQMIQMLRPQRWPKNALVWLPFLAVKSAGQTQADAVKWITIAFCLCAAGAYVWNDLLDLDEDRKHPIRRQRPFARGGLPLQAGLIAAPVLAAAGLALGASQSWSVAGVLSGYLAGTVIYTTHLKRVAILALVGLTGLNLLRVVAGGLAVDLKWTVSLVAISTALCASLAAVRFLFLRR